jgi:phospholipid/cholesterol/gamma-HCH transport system substrate-binding protein
MRLKTGVAIGSFGCFIAVIVFFVGYLTSLGIRVAPPAQRTSLSVEVSDVNNLVPDSNVLLRGVPVGKVTGIDVSVTAATVHFYVESQYKIPVDSEVRLDNLSALGESYIELEPRTTGGPAFHDGERIPRHSIKQPPSISELATSVTRVLNQLDPKQLGRVVAEADAGLPDPTVVLPNLSRTSLLLRNTVADFNGQGRQALDNFQVLLRNAGFVGPALADAARGIRDLGPPVRVIWDDGYANVGLGLRPSDVLTFAAFLTRIQKFLDDRGPDLRVLGESTSADVKLIASSLRNIDSSQLLANLLATVPEDGTIELHVGTR